MTPFPELPSSVELCGDVDSKIFIRATVTMYCDVTLYVFNIKLDHFRGLVHLHKKLLFILSGLSSFLSFVLCFDDRNYNTGSSVVNISRSKLELKGFMNSNQVLTLD